MKFFYPILLIIFISCFQEFKTVTDTTHSLTDPWGYRDSVIQSIPHIVFNDTVFNIVDFGAVAGETIDNTKEINAAINACNQAGGGTVLIPEGIWLTGAVVLKSNVNLHLSKGSTLLFTTQKEKYLPVVKTRFEGMECLNYSPLIYAFNCQNIAVTGQGKLDGQGQSWWNWKGKWTGSVEIEKGNNPKEEQVDDVQKLTQMVQDNVPIENRIFGEGHYLRPCFIEPNECKNVLIEGITIVQSPMWVIHPLLSENIIVRNVKIESLGPNNDGCDPECCTNVLIDSCLFNTGDDCIAIKSGRNNDGRRIGIPSKNIVIQNCTMVEGHGGVVMGSEISGNISYVFAENCYMDSPNLERAVRIKSNSLRGGTVEHVYVRNIKVEKVREAILKINMIYGNEEGNYLPVVSDINLENITSQKSNYGFYIKGLKGRPVNGIKLVDCSFNNVADGNFQENATNLVVQNVKINGEDIK